MSATENSGDESPSQPTELAAKDSEVRPPWYWVRRFLAGNPFYLVSAALLLFGINRLSVDPDFLGAEEAKLVFNFSALQAYEILLVGVGIVLARRRIWYDSTLLIGLENMLVLVPFILVTQALLIGKGLALVLCVAGALMTVLRFGGARMLIPELNMPPGLLWCGLLVLAANFALPVYFRWLLTDGTTDFWEEPGQMCWLAGLPLLQLLANALPRPKVRGTIGPQRSWLPIGLFQLWMAATGVHLWCIGYVAKIPFEVRLLAPLLWVLAWTIHNRLGDFVPNPAPALRSALMVVPTLLTLLGAFHETSRVFLILTFLNAVVYASLYFFNRKNQLAFQLLLASLAGLVAGTPSDFGAGIIPEFSRGRCVALALGGYVILHALLSRRPQIGVCAAIVAALAPGFFGLEPLFHLSLQAGLVFLLLHSVGWIDREYKGAAGLRIVAAVAWMVDGIAFTHVAATPAWWIVSAAAALVLVFYVGARLVTGWAGPLIIPAGAVVSLLAAPANYLFRKAMTSPAGLLAIAASFILFGLGTLLALTKHRWHGSTAEVDGPPPG